MSNSDNANTKTGPDLAAREYGKRIAKQTLGELRSFASQAAHQCPELNEEEFFELIAINYLKGFSIEVSRTFGSTKTMKLLDPFNGKSRKIR